MSSTFDNDPTEEPRPAFYSHPTEEPLSTPVETQSALLRPIPWRDEIEADLLYRALKSEAFRHKLIANPAAVIEQEYAHALPDGKVPPFLSFKILVEDENTRYLVLPYIPDTLVKHELTDGELRELASHMSCIDMTYTNVTCPGTYRGECTCIMCE